MATRVPFPYISGSLDDRSRFELERNFQYLTDQITSTATGWDAIVDPTLAADNTAILQFKTVFAAVKYVADTLGKTSPVIGIRNTSTTIIETGNYGGTTSGLSVHLIGFGGNFGGAGNGTSPNAGSYPLWDMHLFHENSKWQNLIVGSVFVQVNGGTVSPRSNFFNSSSMKVYATDSVFDGQGCSSTTVTCDIGNIAATNCALLDVGASVSMILRGCTVQLVRPTGVSWAGTIVMLSCSVQGPASNCTLTLGNVGQIIMDGEIQGGAASAILTLAVTAAKFVSIRSLVPAGVLPGAAVNVSSGSLQALTIEGHFNEITSVAVPTTNSVGRIAAVAKLRADITGPMNVDLAIGSGGALTTYGLRIRGTGVNGAVVMRLADTASVATALDFISAKRSVLTASIMRDGAASTGCKQYAFDAGSANNILVLEADTLGAASTDAGASDLVITDATFGSSPTTATIDADFSHDFMMGTL